MRPGGGKAKGSAFERYVCKELSLWITRGKDVDVFWRSAMSGGRATVQNRRNGGKVSVRQAGDITAVAPEGHVLTDKYYIECKHVRDVALHSFIVLDKGPLAKFWTVACREAAKHERAPMLIFRQNRWPDFVLLNSHDILVKGRVPTATIHSRCAVLLPLPELLNKSPKL